MGSHIEASSSFVYCPYVNSLSNQILKLPIGLHLHYKIVKLGTARLCLFVYATTNPGGEAKYLLSCAPVNMGRKERLISTACLRT